jgi:6-phosphogluconolactonase (cycloisomerase 2 family)
MIAGSTAATMMGTAAGTGSAAESTKTQDQTVVLYRSVGEELARYEVDVDGLTLAKRDSVTLPANVQYVWPHPSRQYLYVTSSSSGPGSSGVTGTTHRLSAYRILAGGALQPHGEPQTLAARPIHNSLDATGSYLFVAYNNPSNLTVHRINNDGTLGELVKQPAKLDTGIFAHQVLATPSNRNVILVTRGNDAAGGKPEDPGALKVFTFKDGVLGNLASVTPASGGLGFGPRHLDFYPTQPWVYVSIERQNKLHVYRADPDGVLQGPAFVKDTLAEPHNERPRQLTGAIHVHPSGRYVYVANRADNTVEVDGKKVFGGGENSIAVYSIDPRSGEPTLIQHAPTHGFHVRTFAFDPSGRMLVAASITPLSVRDGAGVSTVQAGLSVFHVGSDGRLEFARKYDVETGTKTQFWMGLVSLKA